MNSWNVIGRSVRGASHIRSGRPNQDAIGWIEDADGAGGALLAVADGHGSSRCFRSDSGARLAVDSAKSVLAGVAPGELDKTADVLVNNWRKAVKRHLEENPISLGAFLRLEQQMGQAARRSMEADPILAYGSTLLVTAVSGSWAWCLQLGDGDILTVSGQTEVSRPWGRDEDQIGDETASLATYGASRSIRQYAIRSEQDLPELILLATDGYANSFRDDSGFLEVGSDLLRMIRNEGIEPVRDGLEGWLHEASELGSGDDITVGILWRDGEYSRQ